MENICAPPARLEISPLDGFRPLSTDLFRQQGSSVTLDGRIHLGQMKTVRVPIYNFKEKFLHHDVPEYGIGDSDCWTGKYCGGLFFGLKLYLCSFFFGIVEIECTICMQSRSLEFAVLRKDVPSEGICPCFFPNPCLPNDTNLEWKSEGF